MVGDRPGRPLQCHILRSIRGSFLATALEEIPEPRHQRRHDEGNADRAKYPQGKTRRCSGLGGRLGHDLGWNFDEVLKRPGWFGRLQRKDGIRFSANGSLKQADAVQIPPSIKRQRGNLSSLLAARSRKARVVAAISAASPPNPRRGSAARFESGYGGNRPDLLG